jgi:hypothetical protein
MNSNQIRILSINNATNNKLADTDLDTILRLTSSKVKFTKGHEGESLISGTLLLDKRPVATFHDADYGAGMFIDFIGEPSESAVIAFVQESNMFKTLQLAMGEDFIFSIYKNHDMATYYHLLELISSAETGVIENNKNIKRAKKALVVASSRGYNMVTFNGVKKLSDLLKFKNGLVGLQGAYDRIIANKKPDEWLVNDIELLKSLGVKV